MARSRPRRVALLVLGTLVAVVCIRLGFWQLDRLSQRRAFNDQVREGFAAEPMPLGELLAGAQAPEDVVYRRVVAVGTYDPAHEVILYGRALDGQPGDHVLTPLQLEDGTAILVDRGWVPFEPVRDLPLHGSAAAPRGTVTVEGFLEPPDDASAPGETAARTVSRIDIRLLQGQMPYALVPLALQLAAQDPPQRDLPLPARPPELSEGPHLSYAVQWFAFATVAAGGTALLLRRDHRTDGDVATGSSTSTERGS